MRVQDGRTEIEKIAEGCDLKYGGIYRFTLTNGETIDGVFYGLTVFNGAPFIVHIRHHDRSISWHAIVHYQSHTA